MYSRSPKSNQNNIKTTYILSSPDKFLLTVVMVLSVIGFMAIYSATAPTCLDEGVNSASFSLKQLGCFLFGLFWMFVFMNFDYKKLANLRITYFCTAVILILLLVVQFTGLGVTVNGSTRWISLLGFQLQPSEFAKPVVVMLMAAVFSKNADLKDKTKWPAIISILLMIGLALKQPNLSMAVLLVAISTVMYLCAGGSIKLILALFAAGVVALVKFGDKIIKPYQWIRLTIFRHPETDPLGNGYNIIQSLIAFASGRLFGEGYGGSIQKLYYLPECHTDYIFAIIAEEMGFLGCLLIIGLYFVFIQRGFRIAAKCPDMYGKLLAMGITFAIGLQAFLNMGVASGMLPQTGVPLPFISYGGSSIMVSLCMIGILLNVSRKRVVKIRNTDEENN